MPSIAVKWDSMDCKSLFKTLIKQNKQMDEESFSNMITQVFKLKEDQILQFYILTHCMKVQKAGHIGLHHLQNLFDYCKAKTVKDISKKLPDLQKQMNKPATFKEMYKNVYPMFLVQYTTLDIQYAEALWASLLKEKLVYLKDLSEYLEFLGEKKPKKVHKDLWNMMLQFATCVKDLKKDYSEDDAWPLFIDNFVQWLKEKNCMNNTDQKK